MLRTRRANTGPEHVWCGLFWTGGLLAVQAIALWISSGYYLQLEVGLVLLFGLTVLGTMSGCGIAHALRARGHGGWATLLMVGFALLLVGLPAILPPLVGTDPWSVVATPGVLALGLAAVMVALIRLGWAVPLPGSSVPSSDPRLWDNWETSLGLLCVVMGYQVIVSLTDVGFGWLTWFNIAVFCFLVSQLLRWRPRASGWTRSPPKTAR